MPNTALDKTIDVQRVIASLQAGRTLLHHKNGHSWYVVNFDDVKLYEVNPFTAAAMVQAKTVKLSQKGKFQDVYTM